MQKDCTLKYVKGVSSVTQLSCVQPVTNVPLAAQNLPVGSRLQRFWQTWLEMGSHGHKLLCQSPQERLPDGGITSAYRQKCCRTGSQPDLPRVFQPAVFGTQTQQVETHTGPKQTESVPQGGEIQNGDTGNHQNIPPARGVGHLDRFQGCLLPYSNTGTIQEISEIPCPGPDIPIQGTPFRSVHSAFGVHCNSKGGETDGYTQGYKNPPVPRRLVGTSHFPPDTGIFREGHSNTQVSAPTFTMVAGGGQCAPRSTITPNKTCSASLYRRIKRRVGRSLRRTLCKRVMVTTGKQAAYKLSGTKSSLPGSKRVPRPLLRQDSSGGNRQHNSSGLCKQGRRHEVGPTLCPIVENLDLVYQETSNSQGPTHPRSPKCGSRQTIQTGPDHPDEVVSPSRSFPNLM